MEQISEYLSCLVCLHRLLLRRRICRPAYVKVSRLDSGKNLRGSETQLTPCELLVVERVADMSPRYLFWKDGKWHISPEFGEQEKSFAHGAWRPSY